MTIPTPPAQPSSQIGKADHGSPSPPAGGQTTAAATTAPTAAASASTAGSSAQATIATYRSLEKIAKEMGQAIKELQPTPKQILIVSSESELEGFGEYKLFKQAADLLTADLKQISEDLAAAPPPPTKDVSFAPALSVATSAIGDLISKVLAPLAPKFTFSDVQLNINNTTLARVLASGLAALGFKVFTSLSVHLRQGPLTYAAITDSMKSLGEELTATRHAVAKAPEASRSAAEKRLEAIATSVRQLRDKLSDDRQLAQRLLTGAVISAIVADGLVVHATVNAAVAHVQERSILLWAWRVHAGAAVGTYTAYDHDGAVCSGGLHNAMLKTYRLENLPP